MTEVSANTAAVIGYPITAAVPATPAEPASLLRRTGRRLPTAGRLLAFTSDEMIEVGAAWWSPSAPGRVRGRRTREQTTVRLGSAQTGFGDDAVLEIDDRRWRISAGHLPELVHRLVADGWLSGPETTPPARLPAHHDPVDTSDDRASAA